MDSDVVMVMRLVRLMIHTLLGVFLVNSWSVMYSYPTAFAASINVHIQITQSMLSLQFKNIQVSGQQQAIATANCGWTFSHT